MVEAILLFSPQSSLMPSAARATKVKFHWITQLLALASSIGGFAAIYYNKEKYNAPHFTTVHSWFGLCTIGLVSLQASQGLTVLYPKLSPIARKMKLSEVKKLHAVCGALVFFIACSTIVLGFCSNWFSKVVDNNVIVFFSVLSALALGGVVIGQVFTEYGLKRKPGTWMFRYSHCMFHVFFNFEADYCACSSKISVHV